MKHLVTLGVVVAIAAALISCSSSGSSEEVLTPTETISLELQATEPPAEPTEEPTTEIPPTEVPPTDVPPTPTNVVAEETAVEPTPTIEVPTATAELATSTPESTPTVITETGEIESGSNTWAALVEDELAKHDPGDPARGEELYTSYGCVACHGQITDSTSAMVGPWLGDIADRGDERIEGLSAMQYIYESILYPNDFIAPECPTGPCPGPPSVMRQDLSIVMAENPQDIADVIAFLLSQ